MYNSYNTAPDFVKSFVDTTMEHEAGYVNDPSDSGGETNYGVVKATAEKLSSYWDQYGWDGDMNTMPPEFARDTYVYSYYLKPNFNLVAEQSKLIAQELFDTGVNCGTSRPSKWLQELLNVFNYNEAFYSDIAVDGKIGKGTCTALASFLKKRGSVGEKVFYNALNIKQGAFYIDLATRREKDEKFVWGWVKNRTDFDKV